MGTEVPLLGVAIVAGAPGSSALGDGTLNSEGKSVPGWPFAILLSPDNGPNENMYVCVPSPIVEKPSPPEICWHLMAPFTFVGAVYAGSELLLAAFGCVMVLVGHCTRNDCAFATSGVKQHKSTNKTAWYNFFIMASRVCT